LSIRSSRARKISLGGGHRLEPRDRDLAVELAIEPAHEFVALARDLDRELLALAEHVERGLIEVQGMSARDRSPNSFGHARTTSSRRSMFGKWLEAGDIGA